MPLVKKAGIGFVSVGKGSRAQVALEFVLIAGAVIIMAIVALPFITNQLTLNKANAAARDGATAAINMFNIGYTVTFPPLGEIKGPTKPMRLREANLAYTGTTNNIRSYEIRLVVDFPDDETSVNKNNLELAIGAQVMSYVNYAFTADWLSFNNATYSATVQSNMMRFSIGATTWK